MSDNRLVHATMADLEQVVREVRRRWGLDLRNTTPAIGSQVAQSEVDQARRAALALAVGAVSGVVAAVAALAGAGFAYFPAADSWERREEKEHIRSARIWMTDILGLSENTTIVPNDDWDSVVKPLNPDADIEETKSRNWGFIHDIIEMFKKIADDKTLNTTTFTFDDLFSEPRADELSSLLVTGSDRRSTFVRYTSGDTRNRPEKYVVAPNRSWVAPLQIVQSTDPSKKVVRYDAPTKRISKWVSDTRYIKSPSREYCADTDEKFLKLWAYEPSQECLFVFMKRGGISAYSRCLADRR